MADDRNDPPEQWELPPPEDKPAGLVDEIEDRLEMVGLPTYVELATLLRDVLQPGASASTLGRARDAVRDLETRILG